MNSHPRRRRHTVCLLHKSYRLLYNLRVYILYRYNETAEYRNLRSPKGCPLFGNIFYSEERIRYRAGCPRSKKIKIKPCSRKVSTVKGSFITSTARVLYAGILPIVCTYYYNIYRVKRSQTVFTSSDRERCTTARSVHAYTRSCKLSLHMRLCAAALAGRCLDNGDVFGVTLINVRR